MSTSVGTKLFILHCCGFKLKKKKNYLLDYFCLNA